MVQIGICGSSHRCGNSSEIQLTVTPQHPPPPHSPPPPKKGLFEMAIGLYSCVGFQYTVLSVVPCGKKYHFFLFTFLPIDLLDLLFN